jgi:hypothetical protein
VGPTVADLNPEHVEKAARALWNKIDDAGIEGRLTRSDCDFVVGAVLASVVDDLRAEGARHYAEREPARLVVTGDEQCQGLIRMAVKTERERVIAAYAALAKEWAEEGVPCECGHGLGDHNGLGCYAALTYRPLSRCTCPLTDDRHDGQLAADLIHACAANLREPSSQPDQTTPERSPS